MTRWPGGATMCVDTVTISCPGMRRVSGRGTSGQPAAGTLRDQPTTVTSALRLAAGTARPFETLGVCRRQLCGFEDALDEFLRVCRAVTVGLDGFAGQHMVEEMFYRSLKAEGMARLYPAVEMGAHINSRCGSFA